MAEKKKFDVLSGLRLLFKFTNLYNKGGVLFKYNKYGDSVKIPNFLVFCLIVSPSFYSASLYFWVFVESKFNLELTSVSVAWGIGASQVYSMILQTLIITLNSLTKPSFIFLNLFLSNFATQMALAFISLAMKTDLIKSTIDHLQKVVETSK